MHFQREINVVNPAPLLIRVSHLEFSFSLQNHYSQKKKKKPTKPKKLKPKMPQVVSSLYSAYEI